MSFLDELKRRNVVRVGIAYVVIGWVLAQVAEFAVDNFGAPDWVLKIFVVFLILGLPLALFFAWAFEMTPDGIKREKDVDRSQSLTQKTGRKLDRVITGVLVVAVGVLLAERFMPHDEPASVAVAPADIEIVSSSQSIAVLPFVNMSEDNDHFADGLSEELLNLLAKMPDLKVAGRTSSFEFKGRNDDLREIGDALGVNHVLEGSVRRSGNRLRITAQLIKVDDGFHVWSDTYDREMADIFDIQDDVAGAITDALKLRLASSSGRSTVNPEAYALYLQALPLLAQDDGDHRPAVELLDQAISADPAFAKAYEAKAIVYWNVSGWAMAANEAQLLIYDATQRALELDPSLVTARTFNVTADPARWTWSTEVLAHDAAMQEAPNDPQVFDSAIYSLLTAGYFAEGLQAARRHRELDPLSPSAYMNLARANLALGRRDLAHENWTRMGELGSSAIATTQRTVEYIIAGEDENAIAVHDAGIGQTLVFPTDIRSFIQQARDPDSGRDFVKQWVDAEVAVATNFQEATDPYFYYLSFGYLDDYWRAIEALDPVSSSAWSNAENLEHEGVIHRLSGFTSHPRYLEYQKKYRMTELWDMRGAPDSCSKDSGEWVCE
jgi:TolB-like protein